MPREAFLSTGRSMGDVAAWGFYSPDVFQVINPDQNPKLQSRARVYLSGGQEAPVTASFFLHVLANTLKVGRGDTASRWAITLGIGEERRDSA